MVADLFNSSLWPLFKIIGTNDCYTTANKKTSRIHLLQKWAKLLTLTLADELCHSWGFIVRFLSLFDTTLFCHNQHMNSWVTAISQPLTSSPFIFKSKWICVQEVKKFPPVIREIIHSRQWDKCEVTIALTLDWPKSFQIWVQVGKMCQNWKNYPQ